MRSGRASLWEYFAVMYREPDAPLDPREQILAKRWLYNPLSLLRDIRESRWRRFPLQARITLGVGAVLYALCILGLIGMVPIGLLLWFAPDQVLIPPRSLVIICCAMIFWTFGGSQALFTALILVRGTDRATALLRRRRTSIAVEHGPAWPSGPLGISSRRAFWRMEISRWPTPTFTKQRHWIDPGSSWIWMTMAVIAASLAMFVMLTGGARAATIVLPSIGVAATIYVDRQRCRRLRSRFLDAIDGIACPDCGYSLEGAPGHPSTQDIGDWPGPRRCPECGSRWPLIPPPIPGGELLAEPTTAGNTPQRPIHTDRPSAAQPDRTPDVADTAIVHRSPFP